MEIFELRYFLGVAATENIHQASEKLHVSPASLSKAVSRLEAELSVRLFRREGRTIRLTDQGRLLQRRASQIVQLEEAARVEVGSHEGALQVTIAGPEVLLSTIGLSLGSSVKKKYPSARFEFRAADEALALEQVTRGEAHLALITRDPGGPGDYQHKVYDETKFQVFVGEGHPLAPAARSGRTVTIEEVLKHAFASPNHPLLGQVGAKQSLDGWRDDQFPRRVDYLTSSLRILEGLVETGRALAYLPQTVGKSLNAHALKISGCPYTCVQKIRLVARGTRDIGWINRLF